MKIRYVANDGRVFETQEECEEYEATLNIRHYFAKFSNSPVYFLNGDNQDITKEIIKNPNRNLESLCSIYIKEDGKKWLKELIPLYKVLDYSDYFPFEGVFKEAIETIKDTHEDEALICYDKKADEWYDVKRIKYTIDEFINEIIRAVY